MSANTPSRTSRDLAADLPKRRRLRTDRELRRRVLASGGEDLKKCMQCATCSAVCDLSSDEHPFPRKEMTWAAWGLREELMADVDLWLCHECHECTHRCPRGARPGDVMAALRRECVIHYTIPSAFGRWVNEPRSLPLLLLGSLGVLGAALGISEWTGATQYQLSHLGERIVFPFWTRLPHGLLIAVFSAVMLFDIVVLTIGACRFLRALRVQHGSKSLEQRGVVASLRAALGNIVWHDDFERCTRTRPRQWSHLLVAYGMAALVVVDLWVITARYNPLLSGLVYPLGILDPWKILANLGGLALVTGCVLMIQQRLTRGDGATRGTYADWLPLGLLLFVALSGFASEALHLARVEPARFIVYATHLVAALTLFVVLPYSKLAHIVYRTVALVHAERVGRHASHPATGLANPPPRPAAEPTAVFSEADS